MCNFVFDYNFGIPGAIFTILCSS